MKKRLRKLLLGLWKGEKNVLVVWVKISRFRFKIESSENTFSKIYVLDNADLNNPIYFYLDCFYFQYVY